MEGPTPNSQVKYLHHDKRHPNIDKQSFDRDILSPQCREAQVHDQQTCLRAPDCNDLAVLNNQNKLAAQSPLRDILFRHVCDVVARWQEIGAGVFDDIDCNDNDRVEAQYCHHEVFVGLEAADCA